MIMIIWFDAVTSKEPLLFDAIAKELEKDGHEAIFTCRDYFLNDINSKYQIDTITLEPFDHFLACFFRLLY